MVAGTGADSCPGEEADAAPADAVLLGGANPGAAFCRVRLDLGYDGGGFSGWARQPGRRTVQQVVEEALGRVLRLDGPAALTVAGRTDAGVHARGQVAHADVPVTHWSAAAPAVLRRLAGILPPDVRVGRIGRLLQGSTPGSRR